MFDPGTVIRVPVQFKQGEPKYLVIVDTNSDAHCLVISSRINPVYGNSLGKDSYVVIDVATHPFMHHDSHIDCNEVKRLCLADIQTEVDNDANCIKGVVSDVLRKAITEAIEVSPFLARNDKERYKTALNSPNL